jgi:hypothetical protein
MIQTRLPIMRTGSTPSETNCRTKLYPNPLKRLNSGVETSTGSLNRSFRRRGRRVGGRVGLRAMLEPFKTCYNYSA